MIFLLRTTRSALKTLFEKDILSETMLTTVLERENNLPFLPEESICFLPPISSLFYILLPSRCQANTLLCYHLLRNTAFGIPWKTSFTSLLAGKCAVFLLSSRLGIPLQTRANLLEGGQDRMERQIVWIGMAAQALHLATWCPYRITNASACTRVLTEPRAPTPVKPRAPAAHSETALE